MKNLLLNRDFMMLTSYMGGNDFKQLVEWLYDYAVNGNVPIDEEWKEASNQVCGVFNTYTRYIDYCNRKYNSKIKENEFSSILKEETDKGTFVGKLPPNYKLQ